MREIFMYGSMRGERVVLNSTSLARLLYWLKSPHHEEHEAHEV